VQPTSNVGTTQIEESQCESVTIGGEVLTESGYHTIVLQGQGGCDSVLEINLELLASINTTEISSCTPYTWIGNGQTFESSVVYTQTNTNTLGCDSIYSLDLIVFPQWIQKDTVLSNGSYIWQVDGNSYDISGVYQSEFENQWECDSIYELYLIVDNTLSINYPNVISSTLVNDRFTIYGDRDIDIIKLLKIHDRWGNLMFTFKNMPPSNPDLGWDGSYQGTSVVSGVYVWSSELQLRNGETVIRYGTVAVIH
jgi:hypothetical protein